MKKDTCSLSLDNQLCFTLYSASRLIVQAYQPFLEPFDLTYPQYLVMLVLWEKDAVTVSCLGEKLLLDSGTLSPLLKKLEVKGLISRQRREEDQRIVDIFLTAEGRSLKKKAREIPKLMSCDNKTNPESMQKLKAQLEVFIQKIQTSK